MTEAGKRQSLRAVLPLVSRETESELLELEALFLKWADRINLVSFRTLGDTWRRHVLDSAQLWRLATGPQVWLDLGSGSGFPGLVIATLAKAEGGAVVMVESNAKKSAYLKQAIAHIGLPATVVTERVERLNGNHDADIITARAFASLDNLLSMTKGLFGPKQHALLHKGRGYAQEIAEARDHWQFDLIEHGSLVEADSVILEISGVRQAE